MDDGAFEDLAWKAFTTKPVEDQPWAEGVQILEPTIASPNIHPSPQRFGNSPRGKFRLTPKRGVGFSLGIALETSLVQTGGEGMSLEPIQTKGSLVGERTEPVTRLGQEDLVTPFLIGAKTRPMTRSASKQGPSIQIPASTKKPTKTPGKGSSSRRPKS